MPTGWILNATPSGGSAVDVAPETLPRIRVVRGFDVGPSGLTPRASSAEFTLDNERDVRGQALDLSLAATRMWGGTARGVATRYDERTGEPRVDVVGAGIFAEIVAAESGFTSDYHLDINAADALALALDAAGIEAARRDLGPTARRFTIWWLEETTPLWEQILTIVRTCGPRARIYESRADLVVFRDVAPDFTSPSRILRGRLALPAGAIVSAVDRDDDGRDRVVNVVDLAVATTAGAHRLAGHEWSAADVSSSPFRPMAAITPAALAAHDVAAGDVVFVAGHFVAVGQSASAPTLSSIATSPETIDDLDAATQIRALSGRGIRHRRIAGHLVWPQNSNVEFGPPTLTGASVASAAVNMAALVFKSSEAPVRLSNGDDVDDAGTLVSVLYLTTSLGGGSTDRVSSVTVVPPAGYTLVEGNPASDDPRTLLYVATRAGAGVGTLSADAWTVTATRPNGTPTTQFSAFVRYYELRGKRAVIWEGGTDYTLAAGETIFVAVGSDEPFADPVVPVAGTDFTVGSGAIANVQIAGQRTATSVTLIFTAGPQGASISDLQLRGSLISRNVQAPITARDQASVDEYGPRTAPYTIWPFLDVAQGQALADELIAYGKDPRRAFTVRVDAERDTPSLEAARDTDLADVVRVTLGAGLNVYGEVVGVELRADDVNLATLLTVLAPESPAPPPLVKTAPGRPDAPRLRRDDGALFAAWSAPFDGGEPITAYRLQWREQGVGAWSHVDLGDVLTYHISGLTNGTAYEVQVRATNMIGDGPWSPSAVATPLAAGALELESGFDLLLEAGDRLLLE